MNTIHLFIVLFYSHCRKRNDSLFQQKKKYPQPKENVVQGFPMWTIQPHFGHWGYKL